MAGRGLGAYAWADSCLKKGLEARLQRPLPPPGLFFEASGGVSVRPLLEVVFGRISKILGGGPLGTFEPLVGAWKAKRRWLDPGSGPI